MSDITMCYGTHCPLREECYRYTAKPSSVWQSYFYRVPGYYLTENNCTIASERGKWECEYYLPKKWEPGKP